MALSPVEFAVKDGIICFFWVFSSSCIGTAVVLLTPYLGDSQLIKAFLILVLLISLINFFGGICELLGGASFNPVANIANYCAGVGEDTIVSMGLRIPAQSIGSILGAFAIWEVMPENLKHSIGRPKLGPGVDILTGALVELGLTFFVNLVVLYSLFSGLTSPLVRTALIIIATVIVGVIGVPFTGPGLNPANVFAWAYVEKWYTSDTHIYVYWVAPIIGTILAGTVFRMALKPAPKEKTA